MRIRCTALIALAALAAQGIEARAQEEFPYVDDRSDGAALVRSLYNAINRKEYARAYGYFGASKPVGEFKAFAEGYAKTVSVEAKFGKVLTEGAAGSIFCRSGRDQIHRRRRKGPLLLRLLRDEDHQSVAAGAALHALSDRDGAARRRRRPHRGGDPRHLQRPLMPRAIPGRVRSGLLEAL